MKLFKSLLKDECGAVALEYGMIGALISILVIPACYVIGSLLIDRFTPVSVALT